MFSGKAGWAWEDDLSDLRVCVCGDPPKKDWLGNTTKPWGCLWGQAADRGVVLQLQGEVGLVDDPIGTEDHHLTRLAGKVHLHAQPSQLDNTASLSGQHSDRRWGTSSGLCQYNSNHSAVLLSIVSTCFCQSAGPVTLEFM